MILIQARSKFKRQIEAITPRPQYNRGPGYIRDNVRPRVILLLHAYILCDGRSNCMVTRKIYKIAVLIFN